MNISISNMLKNNFQEKILILSIMLDAYSLFSFNNFYVTTFYIVITLITTFNFIKIVKLKKFNIDSNNAMCIIIMVYLMMNHLVTGCVNVNSLGLSLSYFVFYFFMLRKKTEEDIIKILSFFVSTMNFMALYGIYQFFGRMNTWPLSDLFFDGYMVEGFNWTNIVYGFSVEFERSNAIFREPSFFSQFLAMAILFQIIDYIHGKKQTKSLAFIFLDITAMMLTFSGTGPLVLIVSIMVFFFLNRNRYLNFDNILKIVLVLSFVTAILLNLQIGEYLIGRLDELANPREGAMSGYWRFIAGYELTKVAWNENFLFGCGIGNGRTLLWQQSIIYAHNLDNGLYKVSVELGLIGVLLWIYFIYKTFINKECDYKKILAISLFPLMISSEAFLSNYYWFFCFYLISSRTTV